MMGKSIKEEPKPFEQFKRQFYQLFYTDKYTMPQTTQLLNWLSFVLWRLGKAAWRP